MVYLAKVMTSCLSFFLYKGQPQRLCFVSIPVLWYLFSSAIITIISARQSIGEYRGNVNKPIGVSWSNRQGLTLTPITTGLWAAERPFIWKGIDVGGKSVIARMGDGTLLVHSPVEWNPELNDCIDVLGGGVGHIISPNYEHLKYALQWARRYPDANLYACPGLPTRMPEIPWTHELGHTTPSSLAETIDSVFFDCELNPFTSKPFFNEVSFFHKPSRTLFMADMFWNYPSKNLPNYEAEMRTEGTYHEHTCPKISSPRATVDIDSISSISSSNQEPPAVSVPNGTRLWKFGMDQVYYPFFHAAMVGRRKTRKRNNGVSDPGRRAPKGGTDLDDGGSGHYSRRDRYDAIVDKILAWGVEVIVPCHGDVIRGRGTCHTALQDFYIRRNTGIVNI